MKQIIKRTLSTLLTIALIITIIPSAGLMLKANAAQYVFPVTGGHSISSHFSNRHGGIDIAGCAKQPVVATCDGTVIRVDNNCQHTNYSLSGCAHNGTCGNCVYIKHNGTNYVSVYGHLYPNSISVKVGQTVLAGQQIGLVGSSGKSTGFHLHFEIRPYYNDYSNWNRDSENINVEPGYCSYVYLTNPSPISVLSKPAIPTNLNLSAQTVAKNGQLILTWTASQNATGYDINIIENGSGKVVSVGSNQTSYAYQANTVGTLSFQVRAKNSAGVSNYATSLTCTVKAPVTVTFKDYNGTDLGATQTVNWGSAAVAPKVPTREGYTFSGWDKAFSKVTENITVTATYEINTYRVKFLDKSGNVLGTVQNVEYGKSATPPSNPNTPANYNFIGWNTTEYTNVKSDLTIQGIYQWKYANLPVAVENLTAERQDDGYYINFTLVSDASTITRGRSVVMLKTSSGKLVDITESSAFSLPTGEQTKAMEIFIPCEKAANKVEVIVVDSYSSGVPISKSKSTSNISNSKMWSEWSTTKPTGISDSNIQSRTIYSYRDKEYTTGSTKTLSGWTYTGTFSTTESNWSDWSDSSIAAFTNETTKREVKTRTADVYGSVYKECYYHFYKQSGGNHTYCPTNHAGGTWHEIFVKSGEMSWRKYSDCGGRNMYSGPACPSCGATIYWFRNSNPSASDKYETEVVGSKTQWSYKDTTYSYKFYRWGNWSEWSATATTATSDREVKTSTQYRYIGENVAVIDDTGTTRTQSGNIGTANAGKEVTLYVFGYTGASDYTNFYIGQTTANASGNYSFSYKLRQEPTVETGDLTIAIGIEGTTDLSVIGIIEAPKPTYTVEFYDYNGTLLSTQSIKEGMSAQAPQVAKRTGYTFAGWDAGITNIHSDMVITAKYIADKFNVVYVDKDGKYINVENYNYGDALVVPEYTAPEGYNFKGWDKVLNGTKTVTSNMIISAICEIKKYTAKIYDWNNTLLQTQTVEYGNSVTLPDPLVEEGYIFNNWESDDDIYSVTTDVVIKPNYTYSNTVATPTSSTDTGVYTTSTSVALSCSTPGAEIYYTINGNDPCLYGKKYTTPIQVTRTVELKFVAIKSKYNNSETVTKNIVINPQNKTSVYLPYEELPTYAKENPSTYNLTNVGIGYKYKNIYTTDNLSLVDAYEMEGYTFDSAEMSAWSEWSKTLPTLTDCVYNTESKHVTKEAMPRYRYSHWKYTDSSTGKEAYNYTEIANVTGKWEYISLESALSVSKFVNGNAGYNYNNQLWFGQENVVEDVDVDYILYRYQTQVFTYTGWTPWTTDARNSSDTREYEQAQLFKYAEPFEYIVNLHSKNQETEDVLTTYVFYEGEHLNINQSDFEFDGCSFDGVYKDSSYKTKWNVETDTITQSIDLYVKQNIDKFTVRFLDYDDRVISSQSVDCMNSVVFPKAPTRVGYVFVEWDELVGVVTNDIDIHAVYVPESEYTRVKLSRSRISVMKDCSTQITATITPDSSINKEVVWYSSNNDIATVDAYGNIKGIHSGTAIITAVSLDTFETDNCVVTVLGSVDTEILPVSSSAITVDPAAKYLLGVPANSNIDALNDELQNPSLVYSNQEGNIITESDIDTYIGTGCKVKLLDGSYLIDECEVVVYGDTNGDGCVDVLDLSIIEKVLNKHLNLSGAYERAADFCADEVIDITDYAYAVNEVLK